MDHLGSVPKQLPDLNDERVVFVIPAQAGIQRITPRIWKRLGARLRGHDVVGKPELNSDLFLTEGEDVIRTWQP